MIAVMLVMFLLGFILDFIEITFVVVPIVGPILLTMGLDPVWLGIMIAINLQTSFLTPPFGFALFYLRGVAPKSVATVKIYRGVLPFIAMQLLMLLMLAFAFAMGSLSILFGSLLTDPDQVTTVGIITAMAMSALGGCWWPIEAVSAPFKVVAMLLPTGWTMNGIHKLISFGMGTSAVLAHITVLTLFGIVFLAIGAKRLKWDV